MAINPLQRSAAVSTGGGAGGPLPSHECAAGAEHALALAIVRLAIRYGSNSCFLIVAVQSLHRLHVQPGRVVQ